MIEDDAMVGVFFFFFFFFFFHFSTKNIQGPMNVNSGSWVGSRIQSCYMLVRIRLKEN